MITVCIDAIIDSRPRKETEKEYFTVFDNGKPCRCWLSAKDLMTGADGQRYALGQLFDGENTRTIKVIALD